MYTLEQAIERCESALENHFNPFTTYAEVHGVLNLLKDYKALVDKSKRKGRNQ